MCAHTLAHTHPHEQEECIDSLVRKAGYKGRIDEGLLRRIRLTRYQVPSAFFLLLLSLLSFIIFSRPAPCPNDLTVKKKRLPRQGCKHTVGFRKYRECRVAAGLWNHNWQL
jgi:hypothetical protein